jgi:hypothetical protein
VNFLGSYRFEMKFKAPLPRGGGKGPSAPEAMAAAIAKIADVKTPSELREGAPRTYLHRRPRELRATAGRRHGRAELLARG